MDRNDVYTSFRVKTVVFHLLNVKKNVCNAVLCFLTAFLCSEYFCLFIWLYFFPFKENLSIYFLYQDRKNKKNFSWPLWCSMMQVLLHLFAPHFEARLLFSRFGWFGTTYIYALSTVLTLTLSLSLLHLLHSFSPVVTSYVKSLETASMKLGADNRIVKVQMIEKRENATRHSRSTTAAANFHSLQIASASSWSRNLWAMYDTSSKIRWISGGGRPTPIPRPTTPLLTCGSASSLGELWARPPSVTPESLEGGQCGLSIGW